MMRTRQCLLTGKKQVRSTFNLHLHVAYIDTMCRIHCDFRNRYTTSVTCGRSYFSFATRGDHSCHVAKITFLLKYEDTTPAMGSKSISFVRRAHIFAMCPKSNFVSNTSGKVLPCGHGNLPYKTRGTFLYGANETDLLPFSGNALTLRPQLRHLYTCLITSRPYGKGEPEFRNPLKVSFPRGKGNVP